MINWFDMPEEGLSNGGQFEVKELEVTENGTYETKGEMYNKVVVNVEGGGGSSDFTTAKVTIVSANGGRVGTMFYGFMSPYYAYTVQVQAFGNGDTEIPIILYQGQILFNTEEATLNIASTSGAITYDSAEAIYTITGDCTITIS